MNQKSEFNFISFDEGISRIKKVLKNKIDKVITSRDPIIQETKKALEITKLPIGFQKWQLPVFFEGKGAQFFISYGEPNSVVAEHFHDEGDGMRFIISGSVIHNNVELTQNDWMFIPEKAPYSLKVGALGVVMFYCYQCCCVPT